MTNEQDRKTPLSLQSRGKLELTKTVETGQVRQSFSHGRSKVVTVEVRKKRIAQTGAEGPQGRRGGGRKGKGAAAADGALTSDERLARLKALQDADKANQEAKARAEENARRATEEAERRRQEAEEEEKRRADLEAREAAEAEAKAKAEAEAKEKADAEAKAAAEATTQEQPAEAAPAPAVAKKAEQKGGERAEAAMRAPTPEAKADASAVEVGGAAPRTAAPKPARAAGDEEESREKKVANKVPAKTPTTRRTDNKRRGKLTISAALEGDDRSERGRSVAAMKRAQQKEKRKAQAQHQPAERIVREVTIPETITVQELANRMAERGANVIKALMKMGVMATINQVIDADTAELVVTEFGHNLKRVSEADVELDLAGGPDEDDHLSSRPPVVTVMGHVDHGKTSLLDALRSAEVAAGEAGGITQHIGAYQVAAESGQKITFIDTPGHAAFTAMRARGARVTDIVVLVVAADDGIMPQTIEAIRHAQAAEVPIVVAINKIDLPNANPDRIRTDLLQHEVVLEEMGGDVLSVEVSAKQKLNLDKLEEAILLQAEVLDIKANAGRTAEGVVVEAKMERGRGSVATILVQRGTLKVGDIFVAGSEWGRVRALINDHGERVEEASPAMPVEVLGFQGTPAAGDDFIVVTDEAKAREVSDYRQRKEREAQQVRSARGSIEEIFEKISQGEAKGLAVVVKGDVQGSVEALNGTLEKLGNDEVEVQVLHSAVGAINESDITLAKASNALIIGFNVRANPQAREMARREGIEIRYYSIIYDVSDDVKALLSGMLDPTLKENFLGYAEIREVFNITKVGRVAGCMITEGMVKRGAKVRLLRDSIVIHDGSLGQLKRFKEDAREVREGYECGMSFENYGDIQVGDVIECYEMEEVATEL